MHYSRGIVTNFWEYFLSHSNKKDPSGNSFDASKSLWCQSKNFIQTEGYQELWTFFVYQNFWVFLKSSGVNPMLVARNFWLTLDGGITKKILKTFPVKLREGALSDFKSFLVSKNFIHKEENLELPTIFFPFLRSSVCFWNFLALTMCWSSEIFDKP